MNVAVLLSGGVDSAVVVHRLKEQGIDPTLFYIRIGMDNDEGDCSAEEDIEMCTYIARKYGLPFEVVSLHREYWDHVMEYALRTVKLGLTPNPDMMCNKMIKFGFFEERWGMRSIKRLLAIMLRRPRGMVKFISPRQEIKRKIRPIFWHR